MKEKGTRVNRGQCRIADNLLLPVGVCLHTHHIRHGSSLYSQWRNAHKFIVHNDASAKAETWERTNKILIMFSRFGKKCVPFNENFNLLLCRL